MDDLDFELDDAVIFELPTLEAVEAFCNRLRPRFDGWSDDDELMWLFTARLDAEADVAGLLREAQEILGKLGVAEIRFFLDGRVYLLEARQALVPETTATA